MARLTFLSLPVALLAGLGACSGMESSPSTEGGSSSAPASSVSADPALTAKFPQAVRDAGKITIGVSPNFAPNQFKSDSGELTGSEVDLARAFGSKVGLDVEFVETNFAGLLTGLQADRFDVVLSGVSDTVEREQQVTFVNYINVGSNLLVRTADAAKITGPGSLCGLTAGATVGTTYLDSLAGFSADCEKAGKEKITIQTFDSGNDVKQAIVTNRIDATLGAVSSNKYSAKQSDGAMTVVGETLFPKKSGFLVPKEDTETVAAIQAALTSLLAEGVITEVLTPYDQQTEVASEITVNGATS